MLFLTLQTSLTHSFVLQHVLSNTSFFCLQNVPQHDTMHLQYIIFSCKTPAARYYDVNALWPYCLLAAKTSKGCPLLCKTSLNLSFLIATRLNTSSLPCKMLSTCSFSVQNVVRMQFLSTTCLEHGASCLVLNTSFLVYKTPHNMTQCTLSISFLSCKLAAACYSDRNALWPYCLLAAKTSKGCHLL